MNEIRSFTTTLHCKAVSVNQWTRCTRQGRAYATKQYKEFLKTLTWGLKEKQAGMPFHKPDVKIHVVVNNRMDAHNLIKPICDAIQHSGLVLDDKLIRSIYLTHARHPQGRLDEINITLTEED